MIHIKPLKDEERENLKHRLHGYIHGQCYIFALAVHDGTGWELCGVMDGERIHHAGVRSPDGRFFDGRGFVSEEKITEPFLELKPPFVIKQITPNDLIPEKDVCEFGIRIPRVIAETLWPELPWKQTRIDRVLEFMNELESLCQKHNLWIRSPVPAARIVLDDATGDEDGFTIQAVPPFGCFVFDRTFKD